MKVKADMCQNGFSRSILIRSGLTKITILNEPGHGPEACFAVTFEVRVPPPVLVCGLWGPGVTSVWVFLNIEIVSKVEEHLLVGLQMLLAWVIRMPRVRTEHALLSAVPVAEPRVMHQTKHS